MKKEIGDRVTFGVCSNDKEMGNGIVRRLDGDVMEVEMDNGNWITAFACNLHLVTAQDEALKNSPN